MTDQHALVATLKTMPYLAQSSDQALEGLARIIALRDVLAGTQIINEGDVGEEAYLLISGGLVVQKKTDDGRQKVIAIIAPGSVVGEMALLTRDPRSASVVAKVDSIVAVLDKKAFDLFRGAGPEIAEKLLRDMTRRNRGAINRLKSAELLFASTRLAIAMGDLARGHGVPEGAGIRMPIPLTVHDLADLAVCDPDETAALLVQWDSEGYIRRDGDFFTLLKPEEF